MHFEKLLEKKSSIVNGFCPEISIPTSNSIWDFLYPPLKKLRNIYAPPVDDYPPRGLENERSLISQQKIQSHLLIPLSFFHKGSILNENIHFLSTPKFILAKIDI